VLHTAAMCESLMSFSLSTALGRPNAVRHRQMNKNKNPFSLVYVTHTYATNVKSARVRSFSGIRCVVFYTITQRNVTSAIDGLGEVTSDCFQCNNVTSKPRVPLLTTEH
jgi:hypothetical protein